MALYDEALRYLGYSGQKIEGNTEAEIKKYIKLAEEKLKPKYTYRIFDLESSEGVFLKNTNVIFYGSDIKKHLSGANRCAVMAATLGMESERILSRLSKLSISEAVIFDAVCTAKIEELCDKCENEISETAENAYINFRYSPGYGDFSIDCQRDIVRLLSAEKAIGLTVTDSFLMIPQKSVTAVIGIFEKQQKESRHKCDICKLRDNCVFRRNNKACVGE